MSSGLTPVNRRFIREEIQTELSAALTDALGVYGYLKSGLDGDSPIVRVLAAGSKRNEVGDGSGYESQFYFDLQILVILYQDGADADVMASAAADTLDDLEFAAFQWFADNQQIPHEGSTIWTLASWDNRSTIQPVAVGSSFYLVETIPIAVEVMG